MVRAMQTAADTTDDPEFGELVERSMPRLLAAARHVLRDDEAARDVVQDALLSAVRALPRFERRAALTTWLHRIVINAAMMHLRQRRQRTTRSIEDLRPAFTPESGHVDPPLPWQAEPCPVERAETRAMVQAAIGELPTRQRNVILLRDIEGLDTDQAARRLGVTVNAVKIRLHRARRALRDLLERRIQGTRLPRASVAPAATGPSDHAVALTHRPHRPTRRLGRAPLSAA